MTAFTRLHALSQLPEYLGQTTSALSLSVVLASDYVLPVSFGGQDQNYGTPGATTLRTAAMLGVGSTAVSNANPVPVSDAGGSLTVDGTVAATQSGTWNVTNISGTVSLPTGAATETTLAALSAKHPATLGQKAMAASLAVVLASDQSAIPISNFPTTLSTDSGASGASTIRTVLATRHEAVATPLAVQLSNGSAAIVYDTGPSTSATPRMVLSNRHESASTPVATRGGNGTGFDSYGAGASDSTTKRMVRAATNIAYQAKGKIAGTALTGSYATVLNPTSDLQMIYLLNTCNNTIMVSLDGGTTDTFELEAGESVSLDLASNNMKFDNTVNISAKHAGAAPTAGTIRATGIG